MFDKNEFRFTKTQQMIVMALWLDNDMTLAQLSDRICTSNEQATRAVGQLVKMGVVTRNKNENNRRTIDISLTDEGKKAVKEAQTMLIDRMLESLQKLSESDARTVLECIEKVGSIFNKIL